MDVLERIDLTNWSGATDARTKERAVAALENGRVLFFPALAFSLDAQEQPFLSPACADSKVKNVSFDPASREVRGSASSGPTRTALATMMNRYAAHARQLVAGLLPAYRSALEQARTSYRPVAVEGRVGSWRKDDRRLHVDAFQSRPVQGRRILRVFTNVNPTGLPRVWQVGEPFEAFTVKFLSRVRAPWPGSAWVLRSLHIVKGQRTWYDHVMLTLHDLAKKDLDYQRRAPRTEIAFPSGSTWMVFTDRVLHAALAGQFLFEQTFYLPVPAMREPDRSPLRLLEAAFGRRLT
jgi:hypothetical protein